MRIYHPVSPLEARQHKRNMLGRSLDVLQPRIVATAVLALLFFVMMLSTAAHAAPGLP